MNPPHWGGSFVQFLIRNTLNLHQTLDLSKSRWLDSGQFNIMYQWHSIYGTIYDSHTAPV